MNDKGQGATMQTFLIELRPGWLTRIIPPKCDPWEIYPGKWRLTLPMNLPKGTLVRRERLTTAA